MNRIVRWNISSPFNSFVLYGLRMEVTPISVQDEGRTGHCVGVGNTGEQDYQNHSR